MARSDYSPGDIVQRIGCDSLGVVYGTLDPSAPVRVKWFDWSLPSWENKGAIRMYCPMQND